MQEDNFCNEAGHPTCSSCRARVISVSFFANIASVLFKGIVGFLGGSQALIADAFHSLTDTTSFGINYYGVRTSTVRSLDISVNQTAFIGSITLLAGVWIAGHNLSLLIIGQTTHPGIFGVIVALASCGLNWYLYQISKCVATQFDDLNIAVCKIQNRTNFIASCLSFAGVLLADLGFLFCDPLSAVIIGCLMIGAGVEVFSSVFTGETLAEGAAIRTTTRWVGGLSLIIACFFVYTTARTLDRKHVVLIPSEGPTLESRVDTVLGRARYFVIYNEKEGTVDSLLNTDINLDGDVSHNLIAIVKSNDVDVVLAEIIGPEMFKDLTRIHTDIYYIDNPGMVRDMYLEYKKHHLRLAKSSNVDKKYGRSRVRWMSPW